MPKAKKQHFHNIIPHPLQADKDIKKYGKPRSFATPEIFWQKAVDYFEFTMADTIDIVEYKGNMAKEVVTKKQRPFTLTGFALFAGVTESYFRGIRNAQKNREPGTKEYEEWQPYITVLDGVTETCKRQKFDGAAVGMFNAMIIGRDLGLTDVQQQQTIDDEGNPAPIKNETVMILPENGREAK